MPQKTRRPENAHAATLPLARGLASAAHLPGLGCASGSEAVKDDGTSAAKSAATYASALGEIETAPAAE